MDYAALGATGLNVSRLCFGTLTMGSLQADLPPEDGAALLQKAYALGINFWDTAELYGNYKALRLAIRKIKELPVIATKTYAYTREDARASLEKARLEMDIDVVPIFLLHEQESSLTLQGHKEALDFFCEAKSKGIINAVGISCHTVAAVRAVLNFPEIDVIHPIVNFKGLGIKDGTLGEMLEAIGNAYSRGLGIYGMKALGGGHLITDAEKAIRFVRSLDNLHSFALGISSYEELEIDLHYFYGKKPDDSLLKKVSSRKRQLKIEDHCTGCGTCIQNCPQGALSLEGNSEQRAAVDHLRCILCGYCGAYCPDFCLKIF